MRIETRFLFFFFQFDCYTFACSCSVFLLFSIIRIHSFLLVVLLFSIVVILLSDVVPVVCVYVCYIQIFWVDFFFGQRTKNASMILCTYDIFCVIPFSFSIVRSVDITETGVRKVHAWHLIVNCFHVSENYFVGFVCTPKGWYRFFWFNALHCVCS